MMSCWRKSPTNGGARRLVTCVLRQDVNDEHPNRRTPCNGGPYGRTADKNGTGDRESPDDRSRRNNLHVGLGARLRSSVIPSEFRRPAERRVS